MDLTPIVATVIALLMYFVGLQRGKQLAAAHAASAVSPNPTLILAMPPVASAAPFDPPVAIGEHFTYLGIDMLCIGHAALFMGTLLPGIRAEYASPDGLVRGMYIPAGDMESLRAELARNAEAKVPHHVGGVVGLEA